MSYCNTSSLLWLPENHSGISERHLHVLVFVRLDGEVVRGGRNTRRRRVKRFPCENEWAWESMTCQKSKFEGVKILCWHRPCLALSPSQTMRSLGIISTHWSHMYHMGMLEHNWSQSERGFRVSMSHNREREHMVTMRKRRGRLRGIKWPRIPISKWNTFHLYESLGGPRTRANRN